MRVLKWIGVGLGVLVAVIVVAAGGLILFGQMRWKPTLDRPVYEIQADTSAEGLARGEYLVRSVMGCRDCHSPDENAAWLAGSVENIDDGPMSAVFAVPNLTPDQGTGLGSWGDGEIARAIREGVDKDGVALMVMPSVNYHALSDGDVAAIVGYLRSIEPVQNEIPAFDANWFAKTLAALGMLGPSPVGEPIQAAQTMPDAGTPEYGAYMATLGGCRDCHGENLKGGEIPFADPGTPPAPDLTRTGELIGWSEADFITTMRTGVTPGGRELSEAMPWKVYGQMNDGDLAAIYGYLQAAP